MSHSENTYNHLEVEKKWQNFWEKNKTFSVENLGTKKVRGCIPYGGCSKDNLATPSQIFGSIFSKNLSVVKKKQFKKFKKLSEMKRIIESDNKKIIFDGELLWSHFLTKSPKERNARQKWGLTVLKALSSLEFTNNTAIFVCRNIIFQVVLSAEVKDGVYIVKTFYRSTKLTRKYEQYLKENNSVETNCNLSLQEKQQKTFYALDMFPFPSGAGLHVGHPEGYTATDIICRKKRMEGYKVLHPMGWDAFGLPAENFAIKTGVHPKISTAKNIENFTRQIKSLGFSYDWNREFSTTDEDYYKWSQDLFLKFYEKGLLYEEDKPMNWCPSCKVVCANEEVESGMHERCGNPVTKKALKQWMFRITDYAERLLQDMEKPNVVVIHGWCGNGSTGWITQVIQWCKKNEIEFSAEDFPNTDEPKYEEWKKFFEEKIFPKVTPQTIFIGHSLGCRFLQRYASEEKLNCGEMIFVASSVRRNESRVPELDGFQDAKEFDFEKIKNSAQQISMIYSDNDEFISLEEFEKLQKNLGADKIFLPNRNHLSPSKNPEFPELIDILENRKKSILDWPEKIKAMQRNWIGKSTGLLFTSPLVIENFHNQELKEIKTYNSHFEPFYADRFIVIAPDHELLPQLLDGVKNKKEIANKCEEILQKRETRGFEEEKESEGIFTGRYVADPVTGKNLPIWVASYALADYGTGMVKCSCHDERDFTFAKKYNISMHPVLFPEDSVEAEKVKNLEYCYTDMKNGILQEPKEFAGQKSGKLREKIIEFAKEKGFAEPQTNYRLRDWIFTRQRYWGEPIPLIHCKKCGTQPVSPLLKYQNEYFGNRKIEARGSSRLKSEDNTLGVGLSRSNILQALTPHSVTILSKNLILCKGKSIRKYVFLKNFITAPKNIFNPTETIYVQWKWVYYHFCNKKSNHKIQNIHVRVRAPHRDTVIEAISRYDFSEKKDNYILYALSSTGEIVKIILTRRDGKLCLTTFYPLKKESQKIQQYLPQNALPVKLPETANYEPSASGESPLAKITNWREVDCPSCSKKAERETSTMPNWAGSSWYWLRFMDPKNSNEAWSKQSEEEWGPVDLYVGGAEHAVLHLLYARFWHKALYDMGMVSTKEPFKKLVNQGMILSYAYKNKNGGLVAMDEVAEVSGEKEGESKFVHKQTGEELEKIVAKMSKSLKNVVNPDEIVEVFGADTLRMYEMFMGPFEQNKAWETTAVEGMHKFLMRIWRYFSENEIQDTCPSDELIKLTHFTVKKVSADIDEFKFNTAISQMMVWMNAFQKLEYIPRIAGGKFVRLLAPFAPHLAEEIWQKFSPIDSTITFTSWPSYDEKFLVENKVKYAVQVNGKLRGDFEIAKDASKEECISSAKEIAKVQKFITEAGGEEKIRKEIFVPGKIVGFVVK